MTLLEPDTGMPPPDADPAGATADDPERSQATNPGEANQAVPTARNGGTPTAESMARALVLIGEQYRAGRTTGWQAGKALAAQGWAVWPLPLGQKRDSGPGGLAWSAATTDPAAFNELAADVVMRHGGQDVGVACTPGLCVVPMVALDLDGPGAVAGFEAAHGPLAESGWLHARTAGKGGGAHVFVLTDEPASFGSHQWGGETRCLGGHVALLADIRESGAGRDYYRHAGGPPAPAAIATGLGTRPAGPVVSAADDEAVAAFVAAHPGNDKADHTYHRTALANLLEELRETEVGQRHTALARVLTRICELAQKDGFASTQAAIDTTESVWSDLVAGERRDPAEFRRVLGWAVAKASQSDWQYEPLADDPNEWLAGVPGMPTGQAPAPALAVPVTGSDPILESGFWDARPVLAHVRQYARAVRSSPEATLGHVLGHALAALPPRVQTPALVGTFGSLNYKVATLGLPSSGKDAARSAGRDAVAFWFRADVVTPGSGEGTADLFARMEPDPRPGAPRGTKVCIPYRESVVLTVSEISTLEALMARQGATLLGELTKAWMGQPLGFGGYRDVNKQTQVPEHSYRLVLLAGVQPGLSGVLLDQADSGFPHRFLWVPAWDHDAPDVPPDRPEPLQVARPEPLHGGALRLVIPLPPEAVKETDRIRVAGLRQEAGHDPLAGHDNFNRIKTAAALAVLESRVEVTSEDWQLAGALVALSAQTRGVAREALREQSQQRHRSRAEAEYQAETYKEDRRSERDERRAQVLAKRLAQAVWRHNNEGAHPERPCTAKSCLRGLVASRDRPLRDDALARALAVGWVAENGHEHSGQRVRGWVAGRERP
jgi:hypothetical protein